MEKLIPVQKISAGTVAEIYYCLVAASPDLFPPEFSPGLPEKFCMRRKCELLTIHYIISQTLGYSGKVHYDPSGKPFLPGYGKNISISHSSQYVAVMTAPVPCGVDVEKISGRTLKVAHKFLNEAERKLTESGNREFLYTLLWSAKESLFKITGCPDYLKHMRTLAPPAPGKDFLQMEVNCEGNNREFRVFYTTFDGHVLTWAYEG